MADAVRRRYGDGAVYGSLAYDFSNPKLYPGYAPPAPSPEAEPAARPAERAHTREAARTAVRTRQSIAPGALLGYACAAVLLVLALMAQIRLTSVAAEAVKVEAQLTELRERNDRLLIEYESSFNLAEIERYATEILGMQKPSAEQVFYIDGVSGDKAVILTPEKDAGSFAERLRGLLETLREYF